MSKMIRLFILLSIALSGTTAVAHHSFQATFTSDAKIDVEGVVTKFNFRNPHVVVILDVTNADGSVTNWMGEGTAATSMRRAGWDRNTLKLGDHIVVHGDSTRDGSPMVSLDSIDVLDPNTRAVVRTLRRDAGRARDEYAAKAAPMPLALSDGRPNLTGSWTNYGLPRSGLVLSNIKFNELGQSVQAPYDKAYDPQVFCDAPGLVRRLLNPHPIRITQLDDRVVIEYDGYAGTREIPFGSNNPAVSIKTHSGESVAHYEDNALVIETVNLLGNTSSSEGHVLSDQTTTVERYTRANSEEYGPTLSIHVTVSDPMYLTEDAYISRENRSAGEYEFSENECQQPLRERTFANPVASFFLTSHGLGDGANLGGLEGADQHCADLAATVGVDSRDWRAYLSTTGDGGANARDRIGTGPWYNTKGIVVAVDVDDLHGDANNLTKLAVVDEHGQVVNGRGDDPNRHDILTGSLLDGTASSGDGDTTCSNWTSNGEGSALVGHFDLEGGGQNPTSWNSAHGSRGCSQTDLQGTGGDGLFYCFAAD